MNVLLNTCPVISVICMVGVGAAKALSDLSSEGNSGLPREWRKSLSWKNKWGLDPWGNPKPNSRPDWWYLGFAPRHQEKFYLSSTFLVSITDAWHFFELIRFVLVIIAAVSFSSCGVLWLDVLALVSARMMGFTGVYETIKE